MSVSPRNENDGRMFCELYSCEMSVLACIKRQQNAEGWKDARRSRHNVSTFYNRPGSFDINCQDCEQGRKIMEDQSQEPDRASIDISTNNIEGLAQQVCKEEGCKHAGKSQPIGNFNIHAKSGKPLEVCKDCINRKRNATRDRRERAKYRQDPPTTPTSVPATLTIDFTDHPETLKKIREAAKRFMREPEAQVLYWLTKITDLLESRG